MLHHVIFQRVLTKTAFGHHQWRTAESRMRVHLAWRIQGRRRHKNLNMCENSIWASSMAYF